MGFLNGLPPLFSEAGYSNPEHEKLPPRRLDLLGSVPVPLRHRVKDSVTHAVLRHAQESGQMLEWNFPMGQGGPSPFGNLHRIRSLVDYPNMLVSAEHGNVFNRDFHGRFVETGAFASCQPSFIDNACAACGLADPIGHFGVFAIAPFVMLIDHVKLGDLPVPRRWSDLLHDRYKNQVVFGGWRQSENVAYIHYNKFFLLAMVKQFGLSGLTRILGNVPSLLHSAQMPRLAGTNASLGGIYILPWALAAMCPRRNRTEVVWPDDGALAYPLWLTVKRRSQERMNPLIDHFYGACLGKYLNDNLYPSVSSGLPSPLPKGAALSWLGWDFVRSRATADLIKQSCRLFQESPAARIGICA